MSRVAKNPIKVPSGVTVTLAGQQVTVKGGKGSLAYTLHDKVSFKQENNLILMFIKEGNDVEADAIAGSMRAILQNIVKGVAEGFEKKLELLGVGFRAQVQGKKLNLTLGFSHPVNYDIPTGITIETPSQTEVTVKGVDKQLVGQVAADIRSYRLPEPYKGKGVRYAGEKIKIKEVKKK